MKKLLFCLALMAVAFGNASVNAQNIIDAEDDNNFTNYYEKTIFKGRKAIPYPYLRESDVVWETAIWRSVDFREKFNQFFYFPTSTDENVQGRINLTNAILKAWEAGDIEAYEDDDLKVGTDYAKALGKLVRTTSSKEMATDEETGEMYETGEYIFDTTPFDPSNVFGIRLKEFWYIEKNDTRQKVRIVALALMANFCKERGGGEGEEPEMVCDNRVVAWFPMNDMRVRNILVKANCYDENNINAERSYDDIFVERYFDSYVLRESNRFNRTIASYTVGEDAILLSQEIENKIFDIESDMWEY